MINFSKVFTPSYLLISTLGLLVKPCTATDDTKVCYNDDPHCSGTLSTAQLTPSQEACTDNHEYCSFWAGIDPSECNENPDYMLQNCRKSCGVCANNNSTNEAIPSHAMNNLEPGEVQNAVGDRAHEIQKVVDESLDYLRNIVMIGDKYANVHKECKNRHKDCSFWKLSGECEEKPAYMHVNCALACQTCEMLEYEVRCPMQAPLDNALGPGDLNDMFERILTDPGFAKYEPTILSSPNDDGAPWMIMFDSFATPEECERLVKLGAVEGYERSSDVGEEKFDGSFEKKVNKGRTSTNAWCQKECYEDSLAKTVIDRITKVTGIPERNSEYLQLLKYEATQYYQVHNDYIPHQEKRQTGNRLLTLYVYLNDVEEGGETHFPKMNKTVTPKQGRAVLWPSVLDEDPSKEDKRTVHTALPVLKGTKYGANAWIHMRDFKTPHNVGC